MSMILILALLAVPLFLLLCVGLVLLQIKMSKKESPWPGLMIPLAIFLFSLVPLLFITFTTLTNFNDQGVHIEEQIEHTQDGVISSYSYSKESDGYVVMMTPQTFMQTALHMVSILFLLDWSIPILLIIHFVVRSRMKHQIQTSE